MTVRKTVNSFFWLTTFAEAALKIFFLESNLVREKMLNLIILVVLALVFGLAFWMGLNIILVYGLAFAFHSFIWAITLATLINLLLTAIVLVYLRVGLRHLSIGYFLKQFFKKNFGGLLRRSS